MVDHLAEGPQAPAANAGVPGAPAPQAPSPPDVTEPPTPTPREPTPDLPRITRSIRLPDHRIGHGTDTSETNDVAIATQANELVRFEVAVVNQNAGSRRFTREQVALSQEDYTTTCGAVPETPPLPLSEYARIVSDGCAGRELAPNDSCLVAFEYDASKHGAARVLLTIGSDWLSPGDEARGIDSSRGHADTIVVISNRNFECPTT